MKAIGIIGYKKSGKTTLAIAIARLLKKKNYRVAIIKHSSKTVGHGNTDTDQFIKEIPQVGLITPEHSEIFLAGHRDLKQIIPYFSTDFLIVEGFKNLKYFPKIICLKKEAEIKELDDGLALFTAGLDSSLKDKKVINYLISEARDIKEMVTSIEKRGFMLPDINCGKCGYQNCFALAQAIVKGIALQQKCIYDQNNISIHINKKKVYLNPFMSKLYQNMIHGMFSSLKGIDALDDAQIEIKLSKIGEFKPKNKG